MWPAALDEGKPLVQLPGRRGRRPGVPHLPSAPAAAAGHPLRTHILLQVPPELPAREGFLPLGPQKTPLQAVQEV